MKGSEEFSQNGEKLTWQADGADIYYQGKTDSEAPVSLKVTYYLDGNEIAPKDLAGKSGKVTIHYDYTNNSSYEETVNGNKQTVKVPFAAVTALVLDDSFTIATLLIIFGGVQRIAKVSSIIVPVMALGYIALALIIVAINITELPAVIKLIVSHAFGWQQALGGGVGIALMQGIKRGLFSNEAGMGSAPNVAATAHVTHPVKQGLIQTLGVFTDTLIICTCTAFIILFSGAPLDGSTNGVQLTQQALTNEIGSAGSIFVAIALFFFAFSSILGNYYYGEANVRYLTRKKWILNIYRILVGGMVLFGALAALDVAWSLADVTMGLMALCNLIAISLLGKYAFKLLEDYRAQKRAGIKDPVFTKDRLKEVENDVECW